MNNKIELIPSQIEFLEKTNITQSNNWYVENSFKAGSDRFFYKLKEKSDLNKSYILIVWDSSDSDWNRFLDIANYYSKYCSLLPQIYASDSLHGLILEEYLGNKRLVDFVKTENNKTEILKVYKNVIDSLIIWNNLNAKICKSVNEREMDLDTYLWESDYFARHCVTEFFGLEKHLGKTWNVQRLNLAERVLSIPKVIIHRDFQSENIMLHNNSIKFVDFQGARLGPFEYDLASLLYDPYVEVLTEKDIENLAQYYSNSSGKKLNINQFYDSAIQRLLQALGAYSYLSLHKGLLKYKKFIPIALKRLYTILENTEKTSEIKKVVEECLHSI